MGNVKIRYYVTRKAWPGSKARWGYWVPTPKMKALGFNTIRCGEDGPGAWAVAAQWNERWDKVRRGESVATDRGRIVSPNSLGEAYARFKRTSEWLRKAARTREDWERGWGMIEECFGDRDPRGIDLEDVDLWYSGDPEDPALKGLLGSVGVREAHRAVKIWRALWSVASSMTAPHGGKYCVAEADPTFGIRRKTPKGRSVIWYEGEAVRLIKGAIRMRYYGLAAALAVAWDTMLSPVDVRTLTKAQLHGEGEDSLFSLARSKTGKPGLGTFGKRARRVLEAYMATLPPDLIPSAPIFMTRGGQPVARRGIGRGGDRGGGKPRPPVPYTADTLGDDFRDVRNAVFPGDRRTLMDFRRSGAVEALAGEVDPGALAAKMANTIDQSRELQATYLPHQTAVVRFADAARVRGRRALRGANKDGSKS